MNLAQKAKEIISENIYCTVATASKDGIPWISPVFFSFDEEYNIYWVSNKNARHSKVIESNSQVAIAIFNSQLPEGEGDGVYMEAVVTVLSNENEIREAMKIYNKRVTIADYKVKTLDEVIGEGLWRIYKATPKIISTLTSGEYINGQYVDKREEVTLI